MKTAPVPFSKADRSTNGSGTYGSNARKSFSWSSEDSEVAVTRRIPSDGAATSYRIASQTTAAVSPSTTSSSSTSSGTSSRISTQGAVPSPVKEHHQASSYRVAAATASGPAKTSSSSSGQQQQGGTGGGTGFLSAVSSLKIQAGLSDLSSRLTTASFALFNPGSSSSKPLAPPISSQPSKVSKSPRKV